MSNLITLYYNTLHNIDSASVERANDDERPQLLQSESKACICGFMMHSLLFMHSVLNVSLSTIL